MKKKENRGGRRVGAGRKKGPKHRELHVWISPKADRMLRKNPLLRGDLSRRINMLILYGYWTHTAVKNKSGAWAKV